VEDPQGTAAQQVAHDGGQVGGVGGAADLVVDDTQPWPLRQQPADRQDEVARPGAEQPARADDLPRRRQPLDGLLPRGLAATVPADRPSRIVLVVPAVGLPVEDVVGADVGQPDVAGAAALGQQRRRLGVDRPGQVALALGAVDVRVGRRVDDPVGIVSFEQAVDAVPYTTLTLPSTGAGGSAGGAGVLKKKQEEERVRYG